jgi:hypothetical protein
VAARLASLPVNGGRLRGKRNMEDFVIIEYPTLKMATNAVAMNSLGFSRKTSPFQLEFRNSSDTRSGGYLPLERLKLIFRSVLAGDGAMAVQIVRSAVYHAATGRTGGVTLDQLYTTSEQYSANANEMRQPPGLPKGRAVFDVYVIVYGSEVADKVLTLHGGTDIRTASGVVHIDGLVGAHGVPGKYTWCSLCSRRGHLPGGDGCEQRRYALRLDMRSDFNNTVIRKMVEVSGAIDGFSGASRNTWRPKRFGHVFFRTAEERLWGLVILTMG